MTPAEAAIRIGCSITHVRTLINLGRLKAKAVPLGGKSEKFFYDITQKAIDQFLTLPIGGKHGNPGFPRGHKRVRRKVSKPKSR